MNSMNTLYLNFAVVEGGYVLARWFEVDVGRNDAILHGQDDFGYWAHTGCRLRVANVRLDRSDEEGGSAARTKHIL